MRVRRLERNHLPRVLEIERNCFDDPWSSGAFTDELEREGSHLRAVEIDGEVAAYLIAWFVADEAHIANIAVAPEHRGKGLASALLQEFLEAAYRNGASYVVLEVRVGNERAIQLYEKFHFRRVAVRKNYYEKQKEDAYVMIRHLGSEEDAWL